MDSAEAKFPKAMRELLPGQAELRGAVSSRQNPQAQTDTRGAQQPESTGWAL